MAIVRRLSESVFVFFSSIDWEVVRGELDLEKKEPIAWDILRVPSGLICLVEFSRSRCGGLSPSVLLS